MLISGLEKFALMGASWVLYLLVGLSMVSIGIMCERWWYFRGRGGSVDALGNTLIRLLKGGDRRGAEELLFNSRAIEAEVLLPAMDWLDGGADAVAEILESSMVKKRADLERGLTFLGTLGNNAPFVGLFGTVIGVIQSFHMLGGANGGQNQAAMGGVMVGISEALIATGVGLLVAIPAVVGYNLAQKRVGMVENNVQVIGKQLLALLKSDDKLIREFALLNEPAPDSLEAELPSDLDGVSATEQPELT